MRVLIDTTYSRRAPVSGTAIYLERIIEALGDLDDVEVEPVSNPRHRAPAGGGLGSLRNLLADRWWTAVELPRMAGRFRADVIHHPLPAFARWSSLPQVVTVHDLAFERVPEQFDRAFRAYARRAHRSAALSAAAVICDSETTASDARMLWGVPGERIVVALLGPGQEISRRAADAATHFLYVGDDEPRKNLRGLLAGYAAYRERAERPIELVLAGSARHEAAGVRVEPHASRERLAELYAGAAALIQPSLYEGFGLTALEAMSAGTPVIAANIPVLREICAGAVLYADPRDPRSFAGAMLQLAEQPRLREQLADRGRRRAAQFSWQACASAHREAYALARATVAYPLARKSA
jgi:glycosyltransferase involved in cell wall biosynthesis